jgi:hypothetical protein
MAFLSAAVQKLTYCYNGVKYEKSDFNRQNNGQDFVVDNNEDLDSNELDSRSGMLLWYTRFTQMNGGFS